MTVCLVSQHITTEQSRTKWTQYFVWFLHCKYAGQSHIAPQKCLFKCITLWLTAGYWLRSLHILTTVHHCFKQNMQYKTCQSTYNKLSIFKISSSKLDSLSYLIPNLKTRQLRTLLQIIRLVEDKSFDDKSIPILIKKIINKRHFSILSPQQSLVCLHQNKASYWL